MSHLAEEEAKAQRQEADPSLHGDSRSQGFFQPSRPLFPSTPTPVSLWGQLGAAGPDLTVELLRLSRHLAGRGLMGALRNSPGLLIRKPGPQR